MGLRILPDLYATLTSAIEQDRQNVNDALQQISTGQRVNSLADDPAAAGALVENLTEMGAIDQFSRSISSLQGSLQTADTALNSVVNALTSAISLGTQGANGTLTDSQRQAIAAQVASLQQQIVNLANTTYQGGYVFAGTASTTQPYVADASSPSGIRYTGNNDSNQVEIANGQYVTINAPGSKIFNGSGADAFQALADLQNALQNNGDIAGATAEVQKAFDNVNLQRTFYGNALQQLQAAEVNISEEKLTLSAQENNLIAADPAKAASDLSQSETTLNAALAAFGKISQNTLIDYLK